MSSAINALKRKIIKDLKQRKLETVQYWQEYLVSLYIIRKTDGICLFSHHFNLGYISNIENQLVGMGFIAIANMMQEVVDSSSQLRMIDLGRKKVLLEERNNILSVLIVTKFLEILKDKLAEFTQYFTKIFELQQQINEESCLVSPEDYALTAELVPLIFTSIPRKPLELIPLIFKTIQRNPTVFTNKSKKSPCSDTVQYANLKIK
jgi:hypothetical protein